MIDNYLKYINSLFNSNRKNRRKVSKEKKEEIEKEIEKEMERTSATSAFIYYMTKSKSFPLAIMEPSSLSKRAKPRLVKRRVQTKALPYIPRACLKRKWFLWKRVTPHLFHVDVTALCEIRYARNRNRDFFYKSDLSSFHAAKSSDILFFCFLSFILCHFYREL